MRIEARLRQIPPGGLAMLPIELFQAGYTKELALEADREGIRLASKAGYSATAVSQLFERWMSVIAKLRFARRLRKAKYPGLPSQP